MPDVGPKRLIIYDLDGTLVDTAQDIVQSVHHMLGILDRPSLPRDAVIRCIGSGLRQLVATCLDTDDPHVIERGLEIYRRHYGQHLLDHTALYPSARSVLERFSERMQAVVTNKPNPFTRQILAGLGVTHYFIEIIAGDDGYPRKPDPTAVRSVIAAHGLTAHEVLLVGDSAVDVETGRRAGVVTVAVAHGYGDPAQLKAAAPNAFINNLGELVALASQRGW